MSSRLHALALRSLEAYRKELIDLDSTEAHAEPGIFNAVRQDLEQTIDQFASKVEAFEAAGPLGGKWVVRSMTTTDYVPAYGPNRPAQHPVPYHIYLLPPIERHGAYWADKSRAQLFNSPQEAEAEAKRCLSPDSFERVNIVPAIDRYIPTYWELQKDAWERRARKSA